MKSLFKCVLLGDPSVGKTSIRKRYMGKGFSTNYLPTMGADFGVVNLSRDDNHDIELQIWDLAGQQSFDLLMPRFISNSSGAFFVFDLTRRETFVNITNWIKKFRENNKETFHDAPLYLIGNKADLSDRNVEKEEIDKYRTYLSEKLNLNKSQVQIYYTSALTGENITQMFSSMVDFLVNK